MSFSSNNLRSNQIFKNIKEESEDQESAQMVEKVEDCLDEEDPDKDKYEYDFYIDEDLEDYNLVKNPDINANFDEKDELVDEVENMGFNQ